MPIVHDIDRRGPDGYTDRERAVAWAKFRERALAEGRDGGWDAFVAARRQEISSEGADCEPASAADAPTPQRLGGRALFSRRAAPLGHPAPRTDAERAQKLSGRALMIARLQNGGRQLGAQR